MKLATNGVAGWSTTSSGVPSCSMTPLVHDDDAVGELERLFLIVGDEDAGQADLVVQPPQPAAQLLPHFRVERAERLVEQQHRRLDRQRARQRHALALPARQLRRQPVREEVELHERSSSLTRRANLLRRLGRSRRGRTRMPNATFSNTVMWRKSA